jgi:hypothetical protein
MSDPKLEFDLTIAIPKKTLTHGHYYAGKCRNAFVARWDSSLGVFLHWRTKFNAFFVEKIQHPEDAHDNHFDYFLPLLEVEPGAVIPLDGETRSENVRVDYERWEKRMRMAVWDHLSIHGSEHDKKMVAIHRRVEESHARRRNENI